ncbi:purine-nucleoside phosphorylase [Nakamurella endophytica]|uniref:Uridine phosphorylase n=1 Tax=Nakamurella endophytica TaxID=1748367 RepID=A0A917SX78_9ACTN|nr:purine-nucleoside phosphorylase [Nakamurella endophytica]GGM02268.1 purine nucleoside phosphorylase DeoD-type 2 [Nakamurella endophytica]
MSTPHIAAAPGDFAPVVLMPGDPRRARLIAQRLFDEPRLVTDVRNIEGWTGTVAGRPVSVLASGMGCPSITIYATELFRFYGVRRIVRVGTAGGLAPRLQLGDVVVGSAAHTDSSINTTRIPGVHFAAAPSYGLLSAAVAAARAAGVPVHVGPIFSSDHFYGVGSDVFSALARHGTLAVEMEAAALYGVAAAEGGEALTTATITDHLERGESMTPAEREECFQRMSRIALAAVLSDSPS